jgi:hypothetical protein
MAQLYRLWVGEEDYGTCAEKPAKMWLAYWTTNYPYENARIEEVPDDAPLFLKPPPLNKLD